MRGAAMTIELLRATVKAELDRYETSRATLAERRTRSVPPTSAPLADRDSAPDELDGITMDRPSLNPG